MMCRELRKTRLCRTMLRAPPTRRCLATTSSARTNPRRLPATLPPSSRPVATTTSTTTATTTATTTFTATSTSISPSSRLLPRRPRYPPPASITAAAATATVQTRRRLTTAIVPSSSSSSSSSSTRFSAAGAAKRVTTLKLKTVQKRIKAYPPPPSAAARAREPLALVTQQLLAELDPSGARRALFAKDNPDAARVGDILLVRTRPVLSSSSGSGGARGAGDDDGDNNNKNNKGGAGGGKSGGGKGGGGGGGGAGIAARGFAMAAGGDGTFFAGVCLNIRRRGADTGILLRNELQRTPVEMWFKVFAPTVEAVEVVQRRAKRARRARLYYMRKPMHDIGSVQGVVQQYMRRQASLGLAPGSGGFGVEIGVSSAGNATSK